MVGHTCNPVSQAQGEEDFRQVWSKGDQSLGWSRHGDLSSQRILKGRTERGTSPQDRQNRDRNEKQDSKLSHHPSITPSLHYSIPLDSITPLLHSGLTLSLHQ